MAVGILSNELAEMRIEPQEREAKEVELDWYFRLSTETKEEEITYIFYVITVFLLLLAKIVSWFSFNAWNCCLCSDEIWAFHKTTNQATGSELQQSVCWRNMQKTLSASKWRPQLTFKSPLPIFILTVKPCCRASALALPVSCKTLPPKNSPASLRNFSFTSAEVSLHVLMATGILSPACKRNTRHFSGAAENKDFVLILSCGIATHRTFIDPFVHLAEEALAQDLAHNNVVSGNSVFL